MVCNNCDAPLPAEAVFCAKCGHRVANTDEPSAAPAPSDLVPFAPPPLSPPPSSRRMRLPWFAPMAVILLAVGVYLIIQHQTAGWQVSLRANWTSVGTGSTVRLTASTNKKVDGSGNFITIKDADTGAPVAVCQQGDTCTAAVTQSQAESQGFVATIGDVAHSSSVRVAWLDWNLRLGTNKAVVTPGTAVKLSANATGAIDFARYRLSIVDTATSQTLKDCGHTFSCTVQVSRQAEESDNFAANVSDASGGDAADSNPVAVSWTFQWTITRQDSGTGSNLNAVSFIDANNGWAVGDTGTILHTNDSGVTWTAQQSGTANNLGAVAFTDASTGWVVGDSGTILHTSDGGATWTAQQSDTSTWLLGVAFADRQDGWAVGQGGTILHSSDGGATWSAQQGGTGNYLITVVLPSVGDGWAVGTGGTILHITGQ